MMEPVYTRMIKQSYLYLDDSCAKVSNRRIDPSYRTFAENLAEKYPGYAINEHSLIVNKSDLTINLDQLVSLLKSKDLNAYHQHKDQFFGPQSRFLSGSGPEQMSIIYATYPRSGNSLMRKYFENITGVATGSDMVMKHSPNVALQYCGFKAEGVTDDSVWIKKTHFPMSLPF